jgi:hypothetical protein
MRAMLVALLFFAASCQTSGMSFTRDARLAIEAPHERATLQLPVDVRWRPSASLEASMRRSNGDQYYGVFVDREPVRSGNDISAMVDSECRRTPGCGTESWFNDRGVYFTRDTSVTINDIQDKRDDRARETRDLHQVTVVVMRRAEKRVLTSVIDGTRDGEGAEMVEFWISRPKS